MDEPVVGLASIVALGVGGQWLAEFGVLRAYRGQGLGEAMARALRDRFPGPWHVEEITRNRPAQRFWRRAIGAYVGERFVDRVTEDGNVRQVLETGDRVSR